MFIQKGDSILKSVMFDNRLIYNTASSGATIVDLYKQLEINNFRFFSKIIIHIGFNSLPVGILAMKMQFAALLKWV